MTENEKILGYLGLAQRAGRLASGEFGVTEALKRGKARVVIATQDSGDRTKKTLRDACNYRNVPYYERFTKVELGTAIGKEYRASCAITDDNLAGAVMKLLKD